MFRGRLTAESMFYINRDEATNNRMPLRLAELVKGYPYTSTKEVSTSPNPHDNVSGLPLLSRPRISTRRYDALFVRLETQLPDFKSPKPKQNKHPLRIIAEAFTADVDLGDDHESKEVWEQLKKFASSSATTTSPDSPQQGGNSSGENVYSYPTFSKIFSEDTLRLLSFIPVESGEVSPLSPSVVVTPAPVVTSPTRSSRRRSNSLGSTPNGTGKANGKSPIANPNGTTSTATSPTSPTPTSPTDWADFSSAGFGETSLGKNLAATLLDTDVEVTTPPTGSSRRSIGHQQKKQRKTSPFGVVASGLANRRRSSSDSPRLRLHGRGSASEVALSSAQKHTKGEEKAKVKKVGVVQLDEAFVDFWSDALGDSVSANWPTFFLCQFKSGVGLSTQAQGGGPITWLIIEHLYTHPTVPPLPPIPGTEGGPLSLKRPSSPKPSLKSNVSGRKSSTFSFASRRFSFLNRTDGGPKSPTTGGSPGGIGGVATKKKGASGVGSPRIGEMGEVLPEEDEPVPASTKAEDKREVKGLGISGVESTAAPAGSAPISTTAENKTTPDADADVQPIPVVAIQPPSVSQSVASSVFEPISEKPEPSDEDALAPTPASTSASAIPVDVPVDVPVADEEAPQTPKVLPEQVQQDVVRQQPEQNVVVGPSQATDVPVPASVSQDLTSPDIAVPSLATTHESAPQKDVPEGSVVEDKSLGAPVAEPEHQGDVPIVTPAIPDTKESATEDTNVAKSVVGSEVTTPAVVDAPQGSVVIDVPEEDPTSVVNEGSLKFRQILTLSWFANPDLFCAFVFLPSHDSPSYGRYPGSGCR